MTATDELRRLLDERGVEWEDHNGSIEQRTVYMTPNGWCYVATANDKWLSYVEYHDMTPEQAIDATLGRGTCEVEYVSEWMGWHCKACDMLWQGLRDQRPRYCPNCGKRVNNG